MQLSGNLKIILLKFSIIILAFLFILISTVSCDPTVLDIYTRIDADQSGTRTVELAVKTQYLQKGEITLKKNESIYDRILSILPKGEVETFEQEQYTHFKSTQEFDDINFLQHVSIDNYSETAPERFYAKMKMEDFFFYTNYFFNDYIDMQIDESVVEAQTPDGDLARLENLFSADEDLLKITYQVKFPVKIINSNADLTGDGNIAIWNLKFGETKNIRIEGKRIKYLSYVLVVVLGLITIFILFLIIVLAVGRRRKRIVKKERPRQVYDNYYFKRDDYFKPFDDDK